MMITNKNIWKRGFTSKNVFYLILITSTVINLVLCIKLNIWIDEAYSLNTTSKGISYSVTQSLWFEKQPPGYFVLLNIWRGIDDSILFARIFSLLCIAAALYLSKYLTFKYFTKANPNILTALVAFNPFIIWAASEIRLYALVVLISTIIMISFYNAYLEENSSRFRRMLYLAAVTGGMYVQYYTAFLAAANGVIVLQQKGFKKFSEYIKDMLIPIAAVGIIVPIILKQINSYSGYLGETDVSITSAVYFIINRIKQYVLGINEYQYGQLLKWGIRGVLMLAAVYGLSRFKNNDRKIILNKISIPLILLSGTAALFLAVYLIQGEFYLQERHTAVLFMPSAVFISGLILLLKKRSLIYISVGVLICLYSTILITDYWSMSKHDNNRFAAEYIMNNEDEGQPVVVYRNEAALPLEYYYKGKNKIYPLPAPIDFEKDYNHFNWIIKDKEELDRLFLEIPNKGYIWLITNNITRVYGVDYKKEMFELFINERYKTIKEIRVPENMTVRLLENTKLTSREI